MKNKAKVCVWLMAMMLAAPLNAHATTAREIDWGVKNTLEKFYSEVPSGKKMVKDAKGVLVFPAVYKGGIGLGGEYGEGALLMKGKTADYYNTAAASIGLQLGVQKKSIVILFTQKEALEKFRASSGWKAGVDASIAVVQVGAGGAMDTSKLNQPILGFIFDQAGLMYNLTLEGAKFTKIKK
jgi:lipid-binding SYLF domain-containing protein